LLNSVQARVVRSTAANELWELWTRPTLIECNIMGAQYFSSLRGVIN
jgi:hypothetical protein